ncbi:MAG: VWA domain-containing protein [Chloracidobacterium sp.]|nr:VWA domain-containing protein [Chloracidobacterium sp.]
MDEKLFFKNHGTRAEYDGNCIMHNIYSVPHRCGTVWNDGTAFWMKERWDSFNTRVVGGILSEGLVHQTFTMRLIKIAVFIFACAAFASAQSGRVQQTPTPPSGDDTIKVSTEEIKLNVLAFDDKGNFFRDVTANDIVISENNILHQPASVRRMPANVLIVMDTGGEMRSVKSLDKTRTIARGVMENLRSGDSVAVLQYSDKAEIVAPWSNDKVQMLDALKRTKFGRRSMFVDGLKLATEYLLKSGLDNKHLVLITDGSDSGSRSSAKFEAMQRLLATDISVHVLSYAAMELADIEPRTKGISNSPPPKAMPDEVAAQLPNGARDVMTAPKMKSINLDRTLIKKMKARKTDLEVSSQLLENLAANTNGEFISPDSVDELIEKTGLVARMIDLVYVVTYAPKVPVVDTRGIAERNIDVTSKRPGLVVVARRKLVISTIMK